MAAPSAGMRFALFKANMEPTLFRCLIFSVLAIVGSSLFVGIAQAESTGFERTLRPAGFAPVKKRLTWETETDSLYSPENVRVRLQHVVVPAAWVTPQLLSQFPAGIRRALFFTTLDGREYFRWIFHPDDVKYKQQALAFLRQHPGRADERILGSHIYFDGYRTSTNSLIVVDPVSGYTFGLETSTSRSPGLVSDRKQTAVLAHAAVLVDQHLRQVQADLGAFQHVVTQSQPGAVFMEGINQAQVFSNLEKLTTGSVYHMPLRSLRNPDRLSQLAKANGLDQGELIERAGFFVGRGQAELISKTGVSVNSNDGRNFFLELDSQLKMTGRVAVDNLADSNLMADLVRGETAAPLIEHWLNMKDPSHNVQRNTLSATFLPYLGTTQSLTGEDARLLTGIEKGFTEFIRSRSGAQGFAAWDLRQQVRVDRSGLQIVMTPKKEADLEVLVRVFQPRVMLCLKVHSR